MTRVLESANEKGTVPRARPLLSQSRPAPGDARVAPAVALPPGGQPLGEHERGRDLFRGGGSIARR